jgi:hypothetical protein
VGIATVYIDHEAQIGPEEIGAVRAHCGLRLRDRKPVLEARLEEAGLDLASG